MNYPLISEYIEAIKSAEDNFAELSYIRPVLDDGGLPVMTSGNFAVVFKMKDENSGKYYAVKCFTKEQEGRTEAYHQIAEELKDVDSPYLVSLRYLEKELFVDTLKEMGIKMDIYNYDNYVWFDYQDMGFDAIEDKSDRYIILEYMDLRELGDAENAERMRRIFNKVSKNCDVVISSSVKFTRYRRKILFIELLIL